jgi:hypothetical protein
VAKLGKARFFEDSVCGYNTRESSRKKELTGTNGLLPATVMCGMPNLVTLEAYFIFV